MIRFFIERKPGFDNEARTLLKEINDFLQIDSVQSVRYFNRYDIENISPKVAAESATRIFSQVQSDICTTVPPTLTEDDNLIVWEYLEGQYDQRADSAMQCLTLLRESMRDITTVGVEPPLVRTAKLLLLQGKNITENDIARIKKYLINPVDSKVCDMAIPRTLKMQTEEPPPVPIEEGFRKLDKAGLTEYREKMQLAMDISDINFLQDYFIKINRDPTQTEVRLLDTYWSDHCRHTTFNTHLSEVTFEEGFAQESIKKTYSTYNQIRQSLYANKPKPLCLMDIACIGSKWLKQQGKLNDVETSKEINACSVFIDVNVTKDKGQSYEKQKWLLQFKNETHNHPTEIEPFGGAATCIGGAIRDPLSGRAWVYQALRVTGAGDPTVTLAQTMPGKLPQIKIVREAAQGFSSYGNQIGLATGQVHEFYHKNFTAKRLELGAVIAATPLENVKRLEPQPGDVVILVGGGTGRDGIGGATGSSKAHNVQSVATAQAEVQKGCATQERKMQRLFRNKIACTLIKRCNDFGAGGVAVAVGELADGLDINLDAVPKKYAGLGGTELAISESQERMAVLVSQNDSSKFIDLCNKENLIATVIAKVTDTKQLVMKWQGKTIVDIDRDFLDTAGAKHCAKATIDNIDILKNPLFSPIVHFDSCDNLKDKWLKTLSSLACCSQKGLCERFDGSIGSSTVLFPAGGKYQNTPEVAMVAKIPVLPPYETDTASVMAFGYSPDLAMWSPYHAAFIAVMMSIVKLVCVGASPKHCHLTLQEYFGKTTNNTSWGKPLAALLGALKAQLELKVAAIGGKDSMSGSFDNIDVPPSLVSFAVTTENTTNIRGGAFKKAGSNVYLIATKYDNDLLPNTSTFMQNMQTLYKLNAQGKIRAMYPIEAGGIAEALSKMTFGNAIGFKFDSLLDSLLNLAIFDSKSLLESGVNLASISFEDSLFLPLFTAIIVEASCDISSDFSQDTIRLLGHTTQEPVINIPASLTKNNDITIPLSTALSSWESTLEKVYPSVSHTKIATEILPDFAFATYKNATNNIKNSLHTNIKPLVLLPVFPGTNCEYDMARAFLLAGAKVQTLVLRNNTPEELRQSLEDLRLALNQAQILALSGGFSAADEPDGSGKFIANVLRYSAIADSVMQLLDIRKGLVLGICNGFQALIKTGLLPYGKITPESEDSPTLTFNTIARHISRVACTRMTSYLSPWAAHNSMKNSMHFVPISHGEGRVIITKTQAKELFENGQIFTQYCNEKGEPTMSEPDNPNGSAFAIEGMTSRDGRILGKMGHSERTIGIGQAGFAKDLLKNIIDAEQNSDISMTQNIFSAGVSYFD